MLAKTAQLNTNMITKKMKGNILSIAKILTGLVLILWPQLSINSAQANCTPYSPKTMDSTEPLIINELLLIEDIKKAYKALFTQGDDPRAIVLQFGEIDTTSLNKNEVKPFNRDIQSIVAHGNNNNQLHFIHFRFKPNSLISLSALQKAFGNYSVSQPRTNRTGSETIYTIGFRVDLHGKNINIYLRRTSPDLTADRIEVNEIAIID